MYGKTGDQGDFCELIHSDRVSRKVVNNFIMSSTASDSLDEKVEKMWKIEDDGLGYDNSRTTMSDCNVEVLKFLDENVCNVDGHYELPIPWKPGVVLPNNYELGYYWGYGGHVLSGESL